MSRSPSAAFDLEPLWGGPLKIWRPPERGRIYAIGADTASGKSNLDWAVATVIDVEHGSIVASWRGHAEPSIFAQIVYDLGLFYGEHSKDGQTFLVPEANNHGLAFIDAIRALGYWNLYTKREWAGIGAKFIAQIGFTTSIRTKPMLVRHLREALARLPCEIHDKIVLEEASTFIVTDTSIMEAMEGCHDDALISYALALEGRWEFFEKGLVTGLIPRVDESLVSSKAAEESQDRSAAAWAWWKKHRVGDRRRVTYIRH